jgi:hypothetical protein
MDQCDSLPRTPVARFLGLGSVGGRRPPTVVLAGREIETDVQVDEAVGRAVTIWPAPFWLLHRILQIRRHCVLARSAHSLAQNPASILSCELLLRYRPSSSADSYSATFFRMLRNPFFECVLRCCDGRFAVGE